MTGTPRIVSFFRSTQGRVAAVAVLVVVAAAGAMFFRFARQVDAMRTRHLSGPSWSFPSRVYSDGVPLVESATLPPSYLRAHLEARGYRYASTSPTRPGTYQESGDEFEIFLRGFREAVDPAGFGGPERVRVAIDGARVAQVERLGGLDGASPPDQTHPPRLEPVAIAILSDEHRVRRTWVPLVRVPKAMRDAVVAAEDRRFYGHMGLDLRSNIRALVANVRSRGVREGGSTITQQLARGLFLGPQRTWSRKLSEAFVAIGLELLLSKDEILEMYLNSVYWGQAAGGGVAGVAEAARWYFDAPVESLDVARSAMLAGMIPSPNAISPFRNPRISRERRSQVLRDMVANGALEAADAERIRRQPLGVRRGLPRPDLFPSYTSYVRDALRDLPPGAIERWGLSIFTTLDLVWQPEAEEALREGVEDLEHWRGRMSQPLEGAFVALDPATGGVRAVVGGRSVGSGDFNRVTQARRQPGSAIKPVVYAAALDPTRGGPRFSPASTVPDLRRKFDSPEGPWQPRNDEDEYHPTVTLAKALAKSLNLATANLVEAVSPAEVARYAERFGLGRLKAVPSIGLGTNEVTLLALTDAYAVFPNRGHLEAASPIRAVLDGRGRLLAGKAPGGSQVIPRETAALMTGLLEDVVIFGVSYPLRKTYGFTRPVGGKTGTTNDYLDAWFVGFTPEVAAGVWVGYDQPLTLGRPAAETALPVWARVMTRLLEGFPPGQFPDQERLELAWIDPWTGGLAGSNCPSVMRVPFIRGEAPRQPCRRDHAADWAALAAKRAADSLFNSAASDTLGGPASPLPGR